MGNNGISATVTYLTNAGNTIPVLHVADFQAGQPGITVLPNPLILSQFNVETQDFGNGFKLPDGSSVKDGSGNVLTEYFSLQAAGNIALATSASAGEMTPGSFQFGLMADDGAVFTVTDSAGSKIVVNDDGQHNNTFVCANSAAILQAGAPMPYQMQFFQGQKYSLGLMLFWKRVTPANQSSAFSDPFCSQGPLDRNYWFSSGANGAPVPTPNYLQFAADGWEIVPVGNFFLPVGKTNLCK